jgi:AraC family transcriptional regulator
MYHRDDCLAHGLSLHPVIAGRFHGRGDKRRWHLVPGRWVVSMSERGTAVERFPWGECRMRPGELIVLWPRRWHEVSEDGGQPLHTLWLELDGPGVDAVAELFGAREPAPVLTPRRPTRALRLLRELVDGVGDPRPLPPAHFASRFYDLAELCHHPGRRMAPRRAPTLIERARAAWEGEPAIALGPSQLARRLGVHPNTLLAAARAERDTTMARLVREWKVERARRLLKHSQLKLAAIARAAGFASASQFARAVRAVTGKRPGELR